MQLAVFISFLLLFLLLFSFLATNTKPIVIKRLIVVISFPCFLFIPEYLYAIFICYLFFLLAYIGKIDLAEEVETKEKNVKISDVFPFLFVGSVLVYWFVWVQPHLISTFHLLPIDSVAFTSAWIDVYRDFIFHYDYILMVIFLFVPLGFLSVSILKKQGDDNQ